MPGSPYAFKKPWRRFAARLFDGLGGFLWRLSPRSKTSIPGPPRRVLVVRLDHLGDGLFIGPALAALREGLPESELTLLAGPWGEAFYGGTGLVDTLRSIDVPWFARPRRGGGLRVWLSLLQWIRRSRFDAAVDFRGDLRHLLWFALAGIPVRLGYGRTGGGFLCTHRVAHRLVHEVERNLDLVRALLPDAQPRPLLPVPFDPEDSLQIERALRQIGCDPAAPFLVFHVTAGYASKQWEPEAMARAMDLVHRSGMGPIVVIGTEAERPAIDRVLSHAQAQVHVLAGATTLPQLSALLHRANGFVGHDSGPGHLAVAAGLPAVLLFSGVNDLVAWGPWSNEGVHVLTAPVSCSPCGLAHCNRDHECMRGIAAGDVVHALRELGVPGSRASRDG